MHNLSLPLQPRLQHALAKWHHASQYSYQHSRLRLQRKVGRRQPSSCYRIPASVIWHHTLVAKHEIFPIEAQCTRRSASCMLRKHECFGQSRTSGLRRPCSKRHGRRYKHHTKRNTDMGQHTSRHEREIWAGRIHHAHNIRHIRIVVSRLGVPRGFVLPGYLPSLAFRRPLYHK